MLYVASVVGVIVLLLMTLVRVRRKWFLYRRLKGRSAEERACVKAALAENAALFEPYEERVLVDWVLQELDQQQSAEKQTEDKTKGALFYGVHRNKAGQEIIPHIVAEHGSKPHCEFGTKKIIP